MNVDILQLSGDLALNYGLKCNLRYMNEALKNKEVGVGLGFRSFKGSLTVTSNFFRGSTSVVPHWGTPAHPSMTSQWLHSDHVGSMELIPAGTSTAISLMCCSKGQF